MERVATTLALCLGTWSIHGLPADPHSSNASSRLNCLHRRFKWTRPFKSERPNLVSARVPSRFKRAILLLTFIVRNTEITGETY